MIFFRRKKKKSKKGRIIRRERYLDHYYGFDSQLNPKDIKKKDWEEEEWEGYSYYRGTGLSYRYVDQMANALAGGTR